MIVIETINHVFFIPFSTFDIINLFKQQLPLLKTKKKRRDSRVSVSNDPKAETSRSKNISESSQIIIDAPKLKTLK